MTTFRLFRATVGCLAVFVAARLASGQSATLTTSTTTFATTGGTVTLTVALNYAAPVATPTALGFTIVLPAGWTFANAGGANPVGVGPSAGDTGQLDFAYFTFPADRAEFTVTLNYPAGLSGNQTITASAQYRSPTQNLVVPAVVLASPTATLFIAIPPASQSVTNGGTATFTVTAGGPGPLRYQWRKNGTAISGATSTSLVLTNVQATDAAGYDVVVTNSAGSVTSTAATLNIAAAAVTPVITVQPASQSVAAGASVIFTVTATSTAPLNYQWRKNGTTIPGAVGSAFTLGNVQAADAANYDVVVTNSAGNVTSGVAILAVVTLVAGPTITAQPVSQSAVAGATVNFSVGATGPGSLTYQWRRNGTAIAGATAATLTRINVQAIDAASYDVIVTNTGGSVASSAATLTVTAVAASPAIAVPPASQSAVLGSSATFTVSATGTAPLAYQWRKNSVAIPGASTSNLVLTNVQAGDVGSYDVLVTNGVGGITSPAATLTVTTASVAPTIVTNPASQTVAAGAVASFSVTATGTEPLRYQWRKNGVAIAGATTATFALGNVQEADAGSYDVVVSNNQASVTSDAARLALLAGGSRLTNASVRSFAGAGNETMIVGFAIGGTGVKRVLIRGIGPSLTQFQVSDALADPQLRLFTGDGALISLNDNWGGDPVLAAAFSDTGAFLLAANSKDAAVRPFLATGSYAAHVTTIEGTGVALAELYDADTGTPTARFVNISTRTLVGTGDKVLVAGFRIDGSGTKNLLIRGIGPGLTQFQVDGVLVDPQLRLFDAASVKIQENNDWGGTAALTAAFAQVAAFAIPADSKDAALSVRLSPGNYSAELSGVGATIGIGLIEVYELP